MEIHRDRARRGKDDRGASAVEYGLVLAVFVIAVLGSLDVLYDNTSDFYDESGQEVGAIPTWSLSSTTVTAGGGGVTTTGLPTTTTTVGPTTTTTAPTTTITVAAQSFIRLLEDRSSTESDGDWRARVRVNIHRDNPNGNVEGAVVTGRFTTADGDTRARLCITNENGKCQMTWGNRKNNDSPTVFEVTGVAANPSWDGSTASISVFKP